MSGIGELLDRAVIPEGAHEAVAVFKGQARRAVQLDDGVTYFAGHDQGVAFRFFLHQERDEAASKAAKYPVYRPVEMVEWLRDREHRPTERIRMLPEELLSFDDEGQVVGGKWSESYRRWKDGLEAPGMSLAKWGELSDSDVATLVEMGIFTVEQFAALPRSKVAGRMHESLVEGFDRAIEWTNAKDVRKVADEQAVRIAELQRTVERLEAQVSNTGITEEAAAPKRGRPKKVEDD